MVVELFVIIIILVGTEVQGADSALAARTCPGRRSEPWWEGDKASGMLRCLITGAPGRAASQCFGPVFVSAKVGFRRLQTRFGVCNRLQKAFLGDFPRRFSPFPQLFQTENALSESPFCFLVSP